MTENRIANKIKTATPPLVGQHLLLTSMERELIELQWASDIEWFAGRLAELTAESNSDSVGKE